MSYKTYKSMNSILKVKKKENNICKNNQAEKNLTQITPIVVLTKVRNELKRLETI